MLIEAQFPGRGLGAAPFLLRLDLRSSERCLKNSGTSSGLLRG